MPLLRRTVLLGALTIAASFADAAFAATPCTTDPTSNSAVVSKQRPTRGIAATLSASSAHAVRSGHVAAWVGVGETRGDASKETWLRAGFRSVSGDADQLFYELVRPGGRSTYVQLGSDVPQGTAHRVGLVEMRSRPKWWRVVVDGRTVGQPIFVGKSARVLRGVAAAESRNEGRKECNVYSYRFANVSVRTQRSRRGWKAFAARAVLETGAYEMVREAPATFVASTSQRTPAAVRLTPAASTQRPLAQMTGMSFLETAKVRVGVDLDMGGAITYLASPQTGENLVNNWDLGRQIQQSYYAGPSRFGNPKPPWHNAPWNPIGTGDHYWHPSRVLEHRNDGKTLYVKSIPMQWALDNVVCECMFEQWIRVEGNAITVDNRLTNFRSDKTQYQGGGQELPAAFTTAKLHRIITYDGTAPYTNAPLREVDGRLPRHWLATEHWAALVDDSGWGLGVYHPELIRFGGRLWGTARAGGTNDFATGHVVPTTEEVIDHNIVYSYTYALILGTVDEIRRFAVANRPRSSAPDYWFVNDRQHWYYLNAVDAGWPIRGFVRVMLDRNDPRMIGPDDLWMAHDVPKLYIRAAFHNTNQKWAQVFWNRPGEQFSERRAVAFRIIADGRFHTYEVDLSASPHYSGAISRLRFDPVFGGESGSYVDVAYVSGRPTAVPRAGHETASVTPFAPSFLRSSD